MKLSNEQNKELVQLNANIKAISRELWNSIQHGPGAAESVINEQGHLLELLFDKLNLLEGRHGLLEPLQKGRYYRPRAWPGRILQITFISASQKQRCRYQGTDIQDLSFKLWFTEFGECADNWRAMDLIEEVQVEQP